MDSELKSEKCYWTIQDYKWKVGKYKVMKDIEFVVTINKDRVRIPITYI